jgi:hypothetical protein
LNDAQTMPISMFTELENSNEPEPVNTAMVCELAEGTTLVALYSAVEVATGVSLGDDFAVVVACDKASADRDAASVDNPDAEVKMEYLEASEEILASVPTAPLL